MPPFPFNPEPGCALAATGRLCLGQAEVDASTVFETDDLSTDFGAPRSRGVRLPSVEV